MTPAGISKSAWKPTASSNASRRGCGQCHPATIKFCRKSARGSASATGGTPYSNVTDSSGDVARLAFYVEDLPIRASFLKKMLEDAMILIFLQGPKSFGTCENSAPSRRLTLACCSRYRPPTIPPPILDIYCIRIPPAYKARKCPLAKLMSSTRKRRQSVAPLLCWWKSIRSRW
jgi:hypothetical protein